MKRFLILFLFLLGLPVWAGVPYVVTPGGTASNLTIVGPLKVTGLTTFSNAVTIDGAHGLTFGMGIQDVGGSYGVVGGKSLMNHVQYSWPSSGGTAGSFLFDDGSHNLDWTNTFTGTFIGDGSGLTNLPASGGAGLTNYDTRQIVFEPSTVKTSITQFTTLLYEPLHLGSQYSNSTTLSNLDLVFRQTVVSNDFDETIPNVIWSIGVNDAGVVNSNYPKWTQHHELDFQPSQSLSQMEVWESWGTPYVSAGLGATNTGWRTHGLDLYWNTTNKVFSSGDEGWFNNKFVFGSPNQLLSSGFHPYDLSIAEGSGHAAATLQYSGAINIRTNVQNAGSLNMWGGEISWRDNAGGKTSRMIPNSGTALTELQLQGTLDASSYSNGFVITGFKYAKVVPVSTNNIGIIVQSAAANGQNTNFFEAQDSSGAILASINKTGGATWTGPMTNSSKMVSMVQALTIGGTGGTNVTVDFSTGNKFSLTLTTNAYLVQPTNLSPMQEIMIDVRQDGTGTRTLNFDTNYWKFPSGQILTTTTNANSWSEISAISGQYGTNVAVVQTLNFQ